MQYTAYHLILPRRTWDALLAAALVQGQGLSFGGTSWGALAVDEGRGGVRLHVRSTAAAVAPFSMLRPPEADMLVLVATPDLSRVPAPIWAWLIRRTHQWRVLVRVGTGRAAGQLMAAVHPPAPAPSQGLDRISLPGPEMRTYVFDEASVPAPWAQHEAARWSRTRGAMGDVAWQRLTGLRVGVVGCGRLGSAVADELARVGVRRLVLVDPDQVEPHNVGESSGFTEADAGADKVAVLGRYLAARFPWVQAYPQPHSITDEAAWTLLQRCDWLICCADDDAGRLATALLATLFCIPLLDAGAGVFGPVGARERGVAVRLVLPGDGCLLCRGGLRDVVGAARRLQHVDAEQRFRAGRRWDLERAGSLRSLNLWAVAQVLTLLQDTVSGAQTQSLRLVGTWPDGAEPVVEALPPTAPASCLCDFAGLGSRSMAAVRRWLYEVAGGSSEESDTLE